MVASSNLNLDDMPCLRLCYKLRLVNRQCLLFDNRQNRDILKLNSLTGALLSLCDGKNTVSQLAEFLENICNISPDLAKQKVFEFLKRFSPYLSINCDQRDPSVISEFFSSKYSVDPTEYNRQAAVPSYLELYITKYCNRRCVYCFANSVYTPQSSVENTFLSLDRFATIMQEAKSVGVSAVDITGGEPFLCKDIFSYISIVAQNGLLVKTSTKMELSDETVRKLEGIGLTDLQISLDSFNPKTVELLTGSREAFDQLISSIRRIQKTKLNLSVRAVITKYNIEEIPDLVHRLVEQGVKDIRFSFYGESCEKRRIDLFAPLDKILALNEKMNELTSLYPSTNIQYNDSYYIVMSDSKNASLENKFMTRPICQASVNGLKIRYDGRAVLCDFLMHKDEFVVGDLNKQGIMDIWNSSALHEWLHPDRKKFTGTPCEKCRLFSGCYVHRCHMRTIKEFDTPFAIDPYCTLAGQL